MENKSKVDFEVLISTMNRTSLDFLYYMFQHNDLSKTRVLIINQTIKGKELMSTLENVRVFNVLDKGISKSRNLAIANAVGEICLIADDDEVFVKGFKEVVLNTFHENKKVTLVRFKIETFEGDPFKNYSKLDTKKINVLDILSTSSIEVAFKRREVVNKKIIFNERFGLGAEFKMGEEQLFLNKIKESGLNMIYKADTIAFHNKMSTINKTTVKDKYLAQGAVCYKLFPKTMWFWIVLKLFFDLKQNKLKFKQINKAIQYSKQGKNKLLNLSN
ncbi:glycosyltransferase family A protein [Mangrovimonas spongiae]|uniref:Glycosyltransferase family 2 protein n=1 Tax=Mangrovimonas spongiae TaxID=2494697 RepID=A0A3R9NM89_9FLAO|nr:glycosyltransferase family A protein [Mangrovimonas spongiae]RSK39169.1 glycosyltransferase family 2 protein [Mangrovimonas spongiae]